MITHNKANTAYGVRITAQKHQVQANLTISTGHGGWCEQRPVQLPYQAEGVSDFGNRTWGGPAFTYSWSFRFIVQLDVSHPLLVVTSTHRDCNILYNFIGVRTRQKLLFIVLRDLLLYLNTKEKQVNSNWDSISRGTIFFYAYWKSYCHGWGL